LVEIPGVETGPVTTNILYIQIAEDVPSSPPEIGAKLANRGVLLNSRGGGRFRAVTHYGIDDEDIETAVNTVREVVAR
jgi:threonine aldolase